MGSAEVPPISRIPSMGNHGMTWGFVGVNGNSK
jgi:hypothetical protein